MSGLEDIDDPSSEMLVGELLIPAEERSLGAHFEASVGSLHYDVELLEAELFSFADGSSYFRGSPLAIAVVVFVLD